MLFLGSMMDEVKHWEAICALSKAVTWNGEVPRIKWDLRNAVASLAAQKVAIWDHPEAISELLLKNSGVQKIFATYNDTAIAYALRLARYAKAR